MTTRRYSVGETEWVGKEAVAAVTAWIKRMSPTAEVTDVQGLAEYQVIDVDLLVNAKGKGYSIEVKGDRWDGTGNLFLETVSNAELGTRGCFLYTKADFVYYYFVRSRVLYILPMPETRVWFNRHEEEFEERRTQTPVGSSAYTTIGRLVPIHRVMQEVVGATREVL